MILHGDDDEVAVTDALRLGEKIVKHQEAHFSWWCKPTIVEKLVTIEVNRLDCNCVVSQSGIFWRRPSLCKDFQPLRMIVCLPLV